jgi:lipid-binding SYLF domain-containing protein
VDGRQNEIQDMAPNNPSSPSPSRWSIGAVAGVLAFQLALTPVAAHAASAQQLTDQGRAALDTLYGENRKASELAKRSKAILVFPNITKAGLVVGGQGGEGVLFVDGAPASFHKISAASVGYQVGAQKFGYALFFVSDASLEHLRKSNGWAIGTGPSLVVVDAGLAKSLNTMTLQKEVYAMSFNQRGLMAGTGLEGSRITEISPAP